MLVRTQNVWDIYTLYRLPNMSTLDKVGIFCFASQIYSLTFVLGCLFHLTKRKGCLPLSYRGKQP